MRTLLLGLPLKQAEAILGEAGISPQVRVTERRAAKRRTAEHCASFSHRTTENSSLPRDFLTRFPIRNRKQTDTAGFVGAALCDARLLDIEKNGAMAGGAWMAAGG